MVLEQRKCPNCGSSDILDKNGTYVCINCRTFFDNPNDLNITHTKIIRDEAELEKLKYEKQKDRNSTYWAIGILIFVCIGLYFCGKAIGF